MHLHILAGPWTGVPKQSTRDGHGAPVLLSALLVDHPEGAGLHAVDRPGGVALFVADGDGKSSIVGPDERDGRFLLTLYLQAGTLAPVLGSPLRTW